MNQPSAVFAAIGWRQLGWAEEVGLAGVGTMIVVGPGHKRSANRISR